MPLDSNSNIPPQARTDSSSWRQQCLVSHGGSRTGRLTPGERGIDSTHKRLQGWAATAQCGVRRPVSSTTSGSYASVVGGGLGNTASGTYSSVVGGGSGGTASGNYSTVAGGDSNTAQGAYSLAAGRRAKANHDGAFVWGDRTDADIASTGFDQFIVRASGGIWLGTTSSPSWPDGSFIATSMGAYLSTGGAWTDNSDRTLKEHFATVDGQALLARLAELPIATWNYRAQDTSIRHMGPVAQDFRAAFGLGEDNKHIATVDADGVALAGVQALYRLMLEKDQQIGKLAQEVEELRKVKEEMTALEARLRVLEQAVLK